MLSRRQIVAGALGWSVSQFGRSDEVTASRIQSRGRQRPLRLRQTVRVEVLDAGGLLIQSATFSLVAVTQRQSVKHLRQSTRRIHLRLPMDARAASLRIRLVPGTGRSFNRTGYFVSGGPAGALVPITGGDRAVARIQVSMLEWRDDGTRTRYRGSGRPGGWVHARAAPPAL